MAVTTETVKGRHGTYVLDEQLPPGGTAELFTVVDEPGRPELLYKRFFEPLGATHTDRIGELVEVGREIRTRGNVRLDVRRIAWPVDLVTAGRLVAGVLIPRAGNQFYRSRQRSILQNLASLASVGAPPAKQRLLILRQLASALALLHRHDLVHGDISGTNVLWAVAPSPSMLLIDCDTLHSQSFPMPRYSTKFWEDPRLTVGKISSHDIQSDWYALALAVVRVIVLNSRVTPTRADVAWLRSHLPAPISEPLATIFDEPGDATSRLHPSAWRSALTSVIEDEHACRQIEDVTRDMPDTVAGRRGRRSTRRRPRRAAQPTDIEPKRSEAQAAAMSRPAKVQPRRPEPGKPSWKRKLAMATIAAVTALFALYHFTGVPNWRILNTLDPFLSSKQRALVAALPDAVKHCRGEPTVPAPGAIATVRCEWSGRELIAIKFTNVESLNAYYRRRLEIGTRLMAGQHTASNCPTAGHWHKDRNPHALGYTVAFISTRGARLDWSRTATLTYRIGLGDARELGAVCAWWSKLTEP